MQTPIQPSHLTEQQLLSSEVLALIVADLFPGVVLLGGGLHSLGFYYDFIFEQSLTASMLELIEVHMYRFIKEAHPVRYISMMRENAQTLFEHHKHYLLAERAAEEPSNIIDLIQIESFYGICPPLSLVGTEEVGQTKILDSFELYKDIDNREVVVTRLVGTSRETSQDLKGFLKKYHSFLKKRDHRVIGPALNLFSFSESLGSLGVLWHPKGAELQHILLDWLKTQLPHPVPEVSTPYVVRQDFLGFDLHSLESFDFDGQEYRLRSSLLYSHLDYLRRFPPERGELSKEISECATVFCHIPESERWGLFRECSYLQEQATISCLKEQVASRLISSLHFIEQIITIFGFEAQWYLVAFRQKTPRARQEQEAVNWLRQAIEAQPRSFPFFSEIQEEEGASPRLELRVQDVLGREWPVSRLSVIQSVESKALMDHPERLSSDRLVTLSRQVWDSLDRFIALLIEQHEGNLPLWLVPEQVRVLVVGEANQAYAQQVTRRLEEFGLRVKLDVRQSKLGSRVHEAEKECIPYLVLIGEQERIKEKISVRTVEKFNQSQSIDVEMFLASIDQRSLCPKSIEKKTDIIGESNSLES